MISRKLKEAIKLSDMRAYEIAHLANIHTSTLSRILNGIDLVKKGDPRAIRIGEVMGLKSEECFEDSNTSRQE